MSEPLGLCDHKRIVAYLPLARRLPALLERMQGTSRLPCSAWYGPPPSQPPKSPYFSPCFRVSGHEARDTPRNSPRRSFQLLWEPPWTGGQLWRQGGYNY